MIVDQLRFVAWSILLMLRLPLRLIFMLFAFLSLGGIFVGLLMIFFGGYNDEPLWARVLATSLMVFGFWFWSKLSHGYDSLIFALTPDDREVFLEG